MRVFRYASAVTVHGDLTVITIRNPWYLQVINVIPHRQNDLVCHQFLLHQIQYQLLCHLPNHDLRLCIIRSTMQNLPGADAVGLRAVGFDQIHGHRFVSPGMIDQKLRIDSKHSIQQILIIVITHSADGAAGDISHGKHSGGFQLFTVSCAHPPEVRQRLMVPQQFPIADLIQFCDPYAICIRFYVLGNNIHCHLTQIQICSDPRRDGQSLFLQDFCGNRGCQFFRRHFVDLQILRYIQEYFINGIDMYILRCKIFQVNIIDLCTVLQISRHPGCCRDKIHFQFRMFL